jgi:hypothetical protein
MAAGAGTRLLRELGKGRTKNACTGSAAGSQTLPNGLAFTFAQQQAIGCEAPIAILFDYSLYPFPIRLGLSTPLSNSCIQVRR